MTSANKFSVCMAAAMLMLAMWGSPGIAAEASCDSQLIPANSSPVDSRPHQDGRPSSRKFRLVWLHAPSDHEVERPLPEEFQSIAGDLAQLGFDELEIAGQWVINSTGGVDMQSEMEYDGYVFGFEASGLYSEHEGRFHVDLSATILPEGGCLTDSRHIANWATEIYAQAEELTLVGISPTTYGTAILVMQIMEE